MTFKAEPEGTMDEELVAEATEIIVDHALQKELVREQQLERRGAADLSASRIEHLAIGLVPLAAARHALAEADSLPDVAKLISESEVVRVMVRKAKLGLEAQNDWAVFKLDAIRKAGAMLTKTVPHQGGRPNANTVSALESAGVSQIQSSRWQRISAIPDDEYQSTVAAMRRDAAEIVESAFLKLAMGVHYSSASPEWYTPAEVIERVVEALGAIDLDPCADPAKRVPATKHHTENDDGLARPWHGRVYMNPPYGDAIRTWIQKLGAEYEAGRTVEAIALIPARTDTAWFRDLPWEWACLVTGRLEFSEHGVGAPFPSALLYLGQRPAAFVNAFGDFGLIVRRFDGPTEMEAVA